MNSPFRRGTAEERGYKESLKPQTFTKAQLWFGLLRAEGTALFEPRVKTMRVLRALAQHVPPHRRAAQAASRRGSRPMAHEHFAGADAGALRGHPLTIPYAEGVILQSLG